MNEKPENSPGTLTRMESGPVNPFNEIKTVSAVGTVEAQLTRAAQEVQAAMVIAQRFPRNEGAAFDRVIEACKRKGLAEEAIYAYPKGGKTVSGPSIRLAETLARAWGNVDFGIIELEKRDGESSLLSYCWDLQTNVKQTKIFQVSHVIGLKNGGTKVLTDPRDIYELCANYGARRLRACILGIIPGDVVDAAIAMCEKTMAGSQTEPIIDRARRLAETLKGHGATLEMIEKRLGHRLDSITEPEMVTLRKIYTAIKDGHSRVEDHFDAPTVKPEFKAQAESTAAKTLFPDAEKRPEPEPVKPAEPEPKKDHESTSQPPQQKLAKLVEDAGYDFDIFKKWAEQTGVLPGIDSLPYFNDIGAADAEMLLKASKSLLSGLKALKGMGGK